MGEKHPAVERGLADHYAMQGVLADARADEQAIEEAAQKRPK